MATTNEERLFIATAFDGGMQRRSTKFFRNESEVYFAKNTDFQYRVGGVSKALGYTKKGATINSGNIVLGCGALNTSGGTNKLLAFSGTDAYVWNSGTDAWDAQSRTFTASQKFETALFLDQLFIVNGLTDAPQNYTGAAWSTTTNVTDMPKGKFIIEDKLRLYVFNIALLVGGNFPSRFWYCDLPKNNAITWGFESGADLATTASSGTITSAGSLFETRNLKVGDPVFITTDADIGEYYIKTINSETSITLTENLTANDTNVSFWAGGNYEDVARDNSDVGMGMGKNSDKVLFFKRFSLHKWTKGNTDSDNTLIPVKGVPGTTSHRSIVNARDWTFYFSDTGMWRFDGTSSQLMSNPIQEVIDGVTAANKLTAVGWVVADRIVKMYVGNVSNADTGLSITKCVICYDAFSNAWWTESYDDQINCTIKWTESDERKNFIFSNDGEAFQSEKGNDYNGVAFPMEVETWFYFPLAPEVNVNYTRFLTFTEHGREISCLYKLAYFSAEHGYRVDDEWRRLRPKSKSQWLQEWTVDSDSNRASGFAIKFLESSATNARPVIERIAAFYTGGELI